MVYPSRGHYLHRIITISAYVQNRKTRMLRGLNTIKGKAEKNGGGLVTQSCPTLATPWTAADQAPLSTGFSGQEYWSGLPFPSPEDFPDPEIQLIALASSVLASGFNFKFQLFIPRIQKYS